MSEEAPEKPGSKKAAAKDAKGGKKAKALAAEQERLAEEARRAEEAEAKRLEEERELEKVMAEKRAAELKLQEEELMVKLAQEREEDTGFLGLRRDRIVTMEEAAAVEEEWIKYLECNPLPNVEKESSLNTYLSMAREADTVNYLEEPHVKMAEVLKSCETTEQVIGLLQEQTGKARQTGDLDKLKWYQDYTNTLRELTTKKIDNLTIGYLHQADEYEDEATRVVTTASAMPNVNFGLWVHTSAKHGRVKTIKFPKVEMELDLPVALQKSRTSIRAFQTSYDFVSDVGKNKPVVAVTDEAKKKKQAKKLGAQRYASIGGVVNIQQLALPPVSKIAKGWTMREITNLTTSIQVIPYPAKVEGQQSSTQAPLRVTYKIPGSVYLMEGVPVYGWYDEKRGLWDTEGVVSESYDAETRLVTLSLSTLKPFSIIQPRALDFPYLDWSVTPTRRNTVSVKVLGSRFEVHFEVRGGRVQLVHPSDGVLASLSNKLMDPGLLLTRLKACGLNLLPTEADAKFCRKPSKEHELERFVHEQMAMACGVFAIKCSQWNSSQGPNAAVFECSLAKDSMALASVPEAQDVPPLPEKKKPPTPKAAGEEGEDSDEGDEGDEGDQGELELDPEVPDWVQVKAQPDRLALTISGQDKYEEDPLNDEVSHASLRRALSSHYMRDYVLPLHCVDIPEALANQDVDMLNVQQCLRNLLNLLRPMTFY